MVTNRQQRGKTRTGCFGQSLGPRNKKAPGYTSPRGAWNSVLVREQLYDVAILSILAESPAVERESQERARIHPGSGFHVVDFDRLLRSGQSQQFPPRYLILNSLQGCSVRRNLKALAEDIPWRGEGQARLLCAKCFATTRCIHSTASERLME